MGSADWVDQILVILPVHALIRLIEPAPTLVLWHLRGRSLSLQMPDAVGVPAPHRHGSTLPAAAVAMARSITLLMPMAARVRGQELS